MSQYYQSNIIYICNFSLCQNHINIFLTKETKCIIYFLEIIDNDNLVLQNEDVVNPKTRKPRKVHNADKPQKPPGRPRLPSPPPLTIIPKPPRINKTDDPNYQKK